MGTPFALTFLRGSGFQIREMSGSIHVLLDRPTERRSWTIIEERSHGQHAESSRIPGRIGRGVRRPGRDPRAGATGTGGPVATPMGWLRLPRLLPPLVAPKVRL